MTAVRNDTLPVLARYRPGEVFWFLFLMIGGLAAAFPILSLSRGGNFLALLPACGIAVFTILFCFGPVLFFARVIHADAAGLTCWDWRGKRRIPWEEVQDYYLHLPRERRQSATIRTSQGSLVISDIDRGYEEMRECVREHTGHLPVSEWELLGCRPNDPATIEFRYAWRTEAVFGVMSAAFTIGILIVVSHMIIRDWQLLRQFAGLGWAIGFVVLALHLPVLFGLMTWVCCLEAKDTWGRRNDRITVTANGIQAITPTAVIDAPWTSVVEWHSQEVKRMRLLTSNIVIVTRHGTFDVSSRIGINSNLQTVRLLRVLLERYAGPDTQPIPEEGISVNATKRWTGRIGEDAQVHHYRTPVNRALLIMAFGYASVFPVAALAGYAAGTRAMPTTQFVTEAIGFAAVVAYAQWRYRTAAVITDDSGIRAYTVFGERRLRWEDVTEFGKGEYLATVRDKYGAIRFWLTISDLDRLQKTIQERAVNSKPREWKP